ncbi:MAG TPA: DUF1385 domain-containing protein [Candidatus Avidehalobacter gallistercoris]|uniref:DUF1385 domain-containing protein n=1 Tax=Candidatus Avidehalobacter gallistercoris TaxID=2840694 RepID=A0A9D1HL73_9FIRM|nr:DUF1385 domain-containing protein [Candidatus Avidehalobacter gallistercoris]
MPKTQSPEYFGGQALIEGVMMQGSQGYAMAARAAGGRIVYKCGKRRSFKSRSKLFSLPLIRGVISFAESIYVGFSSLTWSAFQSGEEEEEQLSWKEMAFAIVTALLLTIVFFVILPVFAASFTLEYLGPFGRSLVEGLIRVALFLGYIIAIRRLPDIARVFEYHGAEHKTINAWEAGLPLTVENVKKQSRINCRCGTSFIMMSLILMVIVFTFIGNTGVLGRIITKIIAMPLVMGIAYEVFRLPLKYPNNKLVQILIAPGLWIQRLTTKEPDAKEIEVALTALLKVPAFPGAAYNQLPADIISEAELEAEKQAPQPKATITTEGI